MSTKLVRKVKKDFRGVFTKEKLTSIHEKVYDIPYDTNPFDWLEGLIQKDPFPQKKNRFWCSAFISFILVQVGVLPNSIDWSIVRPKDLSSKCSVLPIYYYEEDVPIEMVL